jgi:hypothetical protein
MHENVILSQTSMTHAYNLRNFGTIRMCYRSAQILPPEKEIERPYLKNSYRNKDRCVTQVIQHFTTKCKTLRPMILHNICL